MQQKKWVKVMQLTDYSGYCEQCGRRRLNFHCAVHIDADVISKRCAFQLHLQQFQDIILGRDYTYEALLLSVATASVGDFSNDALKNAVNELRITDYTEVLV